MRTCYINGQYVDESQANVSIFDRGFLFADSVYEVSLVLNGKLIDNQGHLARLSRSLARLEIISTLSSEEITTIQKKLIKQNQLVNGGIYIQITRGNDGDRDFVATTNITPTIVMFVQHNDIEHNPLAERGISVMSFPDIRWEYCDIKTVGLLGAVMAKQAAKANGFDDAWFVKDGYVTEGSANNAYCIIDKEIITKKANHQILAGITRHSIITLAQEHNLTIVERDFTIEEAQQATEAFVSSATMLVIPVVNIDGHIIADGKPGKYTQQLRQIYLEQAKNGNLA